MPSSAALEQHLDGQPLRVRPLVGEEAREGDAAARARPRAAAASGSAAPARRRRRGPQRGPHAAADRPARRRRAGSARRRRRRRTARRGRRAAPPRRAGWRARRGRRCRRGPAAGTSSRGRRRRRSCTPCSSSASSSTRSEAVARTSTTMSRAGRPPSTSSRSRWASARASARRCGLVSTPASPSRVSSSQPRESVTSSSTLGTAPPGSPGSNSRSSPPSSGAVAVARQQRREALGPLRRVGGVEDVEQLLARAEVRRQRPHALLAERGAALAEDRHVGVAEAVDRLELVADREQVVALERLQHVELEPVGVLELVDHDQREALRPALPVLGVGGEQVAHAELEVLEVEPRALRLGLGVARAEAREQHRDLLQRRAGVVVGAALAVGVEGGCGRPRSAAPPAPSRPS